MRHYAIAAALTFIGVFEADLGRADTLGDILARGEISLGHRADAPPFSYTDETGAPAGLAVELCREAITEIREAAGAPDLRVTFTPVSAAERFDALEDGRIDLLCGPTTQTLMRRQRVDFSIPYFIDSAGAVMRSGDDGDLDDLLGEAAGVLAGTTTADIVGDLFSGRDPAVEIRAYETHEQGLAALTDGEIAVYFADQAILRYQLGRIRPSVPLVFVDDRFSFEPYALTMKRGDTGLRLAVDTALSRIFASGAIDRLIDEALGAVELTDLTRAIYRIVTLPK
ncbi:MAG: amino acid ABC transporter substrate-binding protein [Pseudomonadota bacterium]